MDMCCKEKSHHFVYTHDIYSTCSCTFNSLCKIKMDEMYNDNVYTCQMQIVMCNSIYVATCFMQLGQNPFACVACN
jgi:hypothetical protein